MRRVLGWMSLCVALCAAALPDSESVWRKLAAIEAGRLPPGSRVSFTTGEVNAWFRDEAKSRVPQGARNIRIDLSANRATGSADIDFLKLRQAATGEAPGWLMKNLFAGERPVRITARFESRNGRARVDVERVEVSGIPIEGRTLDLLIDSYVRPTFPDVKVSEWFSLRDRVDRFTVTPSGVTITMGR